MVNGETLFKLLNTKKMGKREKSLNDNLLNGLNKILVRAIKFVDSKNYKNVNKSDADDDFDEWFNSTVLYDDLNSIMAENVISGGDYINNFYMVGSSLGYKQLKRKNQQQFNRYDNQSLRILRDYTDDLFYDLNRELCVGVKETLHDSVENKSSNNDTKKNIMALLSVPILSVVTLNSRCEMIARTEHSRGVNTGTLQAYSNVGVTEANIITSGMINVCDDCLDLEANNPYTLNEAMRLLPFHPYCNCSYEPILNSVDDNGDVVIIDLTE